MSALLAARTGNSHRSRRLSVGVYAAHLAERRLFAVQHATAWAFGSASCWADSSLPRSLLCFARAASSPRLLRSSSSRCFCSSALRLAAARCRNTSGSSGFIFSRLQRTVHRLRRASSSLWTVKPALRYICSLYSLYTTSKLDLRRSTRHPHA